MVGVRVLEVAIIFFLLGIAALGAVMAATSFGIDPVLARVPRAKVIDSAHPPAPARPYQIQVARLRLFVGVVLLIGTVVALRQIHELWHWLPLGG